MDERSGGGRRGSAAEELILRMVAAHADSLLRTARRHSICSDDAQDAYQRTLELFMARADRLDPARAAGWLHVVVKREALAISRSRRKLVGASALDADDHEARRLPSLEDRVVSQDVVSRAAEALQRLKPQELRALWLKAEGHSYNEIATLTGWSYTKVNRCLTEGRRSFLQRFTAIESGAECERWLPMISAICDGEATPDQILELRPHLRNCPGCRATLKALQDSSAPLSALLPVPLAAVTPGGGEQLSNIFTRAYEMIAGGVQDRAVHSVTKAQAALEAATGGKVAAMAASAAAAAGGGYATVERAVTQRQAERPQKAARQDPAQRSAKLAVARATPAPAPAPPLTERRITAPADTPAKTAAAASAPAPSEFEPAATPAQSKDPEPLRASSASALSRAAHVPSAQPSPAGAPAEYASGNGGGEFGP